MWQVEDMRTKQNGLCAICAEILGEGKRMHIDHDPASGRVRGLLCIKCNSALGKLGDSIEGLKRAVAYLEAFEKRPAR